jgi:hypothetical protein
MRPFLEAMCATALASAVAFACGNKAGSSGFASASSSSGTGSSSGSGSNSSGGGSTSGGGTASGSGGTLFGDSGLTDAAPCVGRECQAANCGSGTDTTLTGTVRDPAGRLGLYDVYVYVPNDTPDPIPLGHPTCTSCEAPASGHPILGTLTDADGKFTLRKGPSDTWGVPAGQNIPLVIQSGKWRRQLVIPQVAGCATNDLDTVLGADKMRLPKNSSEGDMPLIAFTSGCDPAECFLRHIGIDDSEFVPPGGHGHVQFFAGQDSVHMGSASAIADGGVFQQTYEWWTDPMNLLSYDIVFNACECFNYDRNLYSPGTPGSDAYKAMDAYLSGGGRLFATHYFYNWFASPTGTPDLNSVASWNTMGKLTMAQQEMDTIDTSFPKGMAFAQWLQNNNVSTTMGNITLYDTRDNVVSPLPAGCSGASCLSTQWIVHPGDNEPRYLTFNTPVGAMPTQQCGRAVFSDVHLSGSSNDAQFPGECANPDPNYANNEKALEFLFFDLSSCIQPPDQPPPPPTPR